VSDEVAESQLAASDFVLLDEEDTAGQVTAKGDEVSFIQRLDAAAFERMDFIFSGWCECDEKASDGLRRGSRQNSANK